MDKPTGSKNHRNGAYRALRNSQNLALGERVVKLPWSERHEYEQQESELERQQGRESRGMSRGPARIVGQAKPTC